MCDTEELQAHNKGEFSLPRKLTPFPMGIVKLNSSSTVRGLTYWFHCV